MNPLLFLLALIFGSIVGSYVAAMLVGRLGVTWPWPRRGRGSAGTAGRAPDRTSPPTSSSGLEMLPEPPTNVRLLTEDLEEWPVEVAYRGIDEEGNHVWVATTHWRGTPKGVLVGTLPPHTAVSIEFTP